MKATGNARAQFDYIRDQTNEGLNKYVEQLREQGALFYSKFNSDLCSIQNSIRDSQLEKHGLTKRLKDLEHLEQIIFEPQVLADLLPCAKALQSAKFTAAVKQELAVHILDQSVRESTSLIDCNLVTDEDLRDIL